jgi:hypothetical protein
MQGAGAGWSGRPGAPAPAAVLFAAGAGVISAGSASSVTDALEAAGRAHSLQGAGSALVEGITSALDLESAYLYVLEEDAGAECLRLLAHTGEHSAFMADTPTITLDADLPVVRVLLTGASDYHADPHGLGEPLETAPGVGRWRAAIGAQAEATLPLVAQDRPVGALALSWHAPRDFTDADRRELERIASGVASVVDGFARRPPAPQGAGCRESATASFTVDREGRISKGPDASRPVLRIGAATEYSRQDGYSAFCQVAPSTDARTAIALGVVKAADGSAAARAVEAKRLLCGWICHGLEPAAALDALCAWEAGDGEEVQEICAVTCIVDMARRCVTYATTRHGLAAVLTPDARFLFDAAVADPDAPGLPASERAAILLPGDRLALWSGDAPGLAGAGGSAFVRRALAGAPSREGSRAAALIGTRGAGGCNAEVAVVVDVGDA